ncbi:MAG: hypothetical protein ACJAS4_001870 [Bacteriovoracaceae bacterium]|jgi:hypothetical protein
MPVRSIAISSTGKGLVLLKKSIEIGAEFIISLPKDPEKLQGALNHVNDLFNQMGLNIRLKIKADFSIEVLLIRAGVGGVVFAIAGTILGFGWLAPAFVGAGLGAATELIEVERVQVSVFNGNPAVCMSFA